MNIFNEVINIGSGGGYSINQVLVYITGNHPDIDIEYKPSRKYDIQRIILDTKKLKTLENFQLTDIRNGIDITYQWCKERYADGKKGTH